MLFFHLRLVLPNGFLLPDFQIKFCIYSFEYQDVLAGGYVRTSKVPETSFFRRTFTVTFAVQDEISVKR